MRRNGEFAAAAAALRDRPGTRCCARTGSHTVLDNPAVGGNLQDHLAVVYSFKATRPTLNDELHSRLGRTMAGVRYLLTRRGPVSLSVNQFGGFVRANPQASRPDVQLYFNPVTYRRAMRRAHASSWMRFPGSICAFSRPARPASGRIDLASGDFRTRPAIAPDYLSTDKDVADVVARRAADAGHRPHARHPAASSASRSRPISCGMSDADLVADFRARAATVYHPVGTCRMGPGAQRLRGRSLPARARHGALARRRCLGLPDGHLGQHQRAHAHGRAKGGRSHRGRMSQPTRKDGSDMKLDSVKVFVVGNPPPGYGGRYFVFLKLKTACGIEGVGEVYAATFGPKIIASMIEDVFARRFAGTRSVSHRGRVARELRLGLHPAAGSVAHERSERIGNGLLGHHRQGGGSAGLSAARGPRARAVAHLHATSIRPTERARTSITTPSARRRAPPST